MFMIQLPHPTQLKMIYVAVAEMPAALRESTRGTAEEQQHKVLMVRLAPPVTMHGPAKIDAANYGLCLNEEYKQDHERHAISVVVGAVRFFLECPDECFVVIYPTHFPAPETHDAYSQCVMNMWLEAVRLKLEHNAKRAAAAASASSGPTE